MFSLTGIIFALGAAVVWGTSDFTGGFASRKHNQYQVMVMAALPGVIVLAICALLSKEHLPTQREMLWSALAGTVGSIGLAALYNGLSLGYMAVIAPTAGVLGAAIPVAYSLLTQGMRGPLQLGGMVIALLGIWQVSRSPEASPQLMRRSLGLGVLAGVAFGGFFIFIAQVPPGKVFLPLIISKTMTCVVAFILLLIQHDRVPSLGSNRPALLSGGLDAIGNALYLLASHHTTLAIAAVLGSMYPAMTVMLAWLLLKEKIALPQWVGVGLCITAIALIVA